MNWVLIVGLLLNLVLLPIALLRVVWLYRLITSGQPDPGRIEGVTGRVGQTLKTQLVEVFAQKKLLKWTVPGAAHLFVFWAFLILASVYLEAYGVLLSRNPLDRVENSRSIVSVIADGRVIGQVVTAR